MEQKKSEFHFSIDRGGTFTDIYCEIVDPASKERKCQVLKLLSVDPGNYKDAPTEGIRRILEGQLGIKVDRETKIPT